MKPKIILILLIQYFSMSSWGQCIGNPDFATYCGTTITIAGCPTFNSPCAANWIRSHGTPQIFVPNPSNPSQNIAYMWSASSAGEGLFSDFNF